MKTLVACLFLSILSNDRASATPQIICSYQVTNIATNALGYVYAQFGGIGGPYAICNVNSNIGVTFGDGSSGTISTNSCQTQQAMLLTAMTTGKKVTVYVFSDQTSCSSVFGANFSFINPYPNFISIDN